MSRFYFHVHGTVDAYDDEGRELDDLAAARTAAIRSARHLMCDEIQHTGRTSLSHSIRIESPQGVPLHTLRFGDAVEVES